MDLTKDLNNAPYPDFKNIDEIFHRYIHRKWLNMKISQTMRQGRDLKMFLRQDVQIHSSKISVQNGTSKVSVQIEIYHLKASKISVQTWP